MPTNMILNAPTYQPAT